MSQTFQVVLILHQVSVRFQYDLRHSDSTPGSWSIIRSSDLRYTATELHNLLIYVGGGVMSQLYKIEQEFDHYLPCHFIVISDDVYM